MRYGAEPPRSSSSRSRSSRTTRAAADRLVITEVDLQPEGDTTFPPIDPGVWKIVNRQEYAAQPGDDASFTVTTYERMQSGG